MTGRQVRVLVYAVCLFPVDVVVGVVLLVAQIAALPLRASSPARNFAEPNTSKITVQILNWDGRQLLEEFLPAVVRASEGHEVLLVDNGSKDDSVAFVRRQFPQVRLVQLERNFGYSAGNNRGMECAETDVVVLLNNDVAPDRDFLAPLLAPFSDPKVFAVASRITVPDPAKVSYETGNTRGRFESGLFYLWHEPIQEGPQPQTLPVFWAGGGACAIDRRKFKELGGFDRLYAPFYVEDTDLSYRAWKRGWQSILATESHVCHKHRATSGPRFGELFVNNTTRRNHYLFVWKNVTDTGMLVEHILSLPLIHYRAIFQYGAAFEYRAYLRAFLRFPLALKRRLTTDRDTVLSDSDVMDLFR